MLQQIVFLFIVIQCKTQELKQGWALVGNPLAFAHPCKGNDNITASFESGMPPGLENQYHVYISEMFSKHSRVNIKFDSEAVITMNNNSNARISTIGEEFFINFFDKATGLSFHVKGPPSGLMPYMKSIIVNTVQYCEDPEIGVFDNYILGNQNTAEVQLSVPEFSCGRRKVQYTELITNGLATKPGDWPWHTALYRLEKAGIKYICGGTLISKSFVLTAAHCTSIRGAPVLPEILSVILGKYNLIGGDIATQEREVHEIIMHENFSSRGLNHDISLLKLKSEAVFDDYVQPICMWHAGVNKKLPSGQIFGTVAGWGFDQTDSLSSQIKQATIPKVSETTCIKSNPVFFGNLLTSNKFCAGLNNGTSACNGDSGGGFVVFVPDVYGDSSPNAPGSWFLRGIVSLSVSRRDAAICDPSQYVLFTDVSKYKGWLKKHIGDL